MSDIVSWIWFTERRGLSSRSRAALLERIGPPCEIVKATPQALAECGLTQTETEQLLERDMLPAERIIGRCEELGVQILTQQDALYPERLKNIPDPPGVLYLKGRLPAVDCEAAVGLVGTRRATPYGNQMARNLGYGLAKGGALVVTGLAAGNDSQGAIGALMAGGRVIGVLGTAINEVFPRFNGELFEDVAATGALVSEYPPDAPGSRMYFPARNRIIAGLSLGVVVVEAPKGSGALITARRALDYGRDVFAVPGNADAVNSRGSNELIQEGARLCTGAKDILCEYCQLFPEKLSMSERQTVPGRMYAPRLGQPEEKPEAQAAEESQNADIVIPKPEGLIAAAPKLETQLSALSRTQLQIVSVMTKPSMHIDDIIDLSGLAASTVLAEMTLLQIKGYVAQESGKRFTLKITKRG